LNFPKNSAEAVDWVDFDGNTRKEDFAKASTNLRSRSYGIAESTSVEGQELYFRRMVAIEAKQQQRINEQIRTTPVRVIGADGSQLGIMPTADAIDSARQANLDLVEVAPNERPPVCRVMDFGKFKYQQKKRLHKTHTRQMKIKEIRVRPKTGDHDIQVKTSKAREFLEHKDKVLLSVMFRGRELAHIEEGRRVIDEIIHLLEDVAKTESYPNQQGKRIICTLTPK
jgi:translation initiation factor IF-3